MRRPASCISVACLFLFGCATVLPQSSALDDVHRIYRDEFVASQIPIPRIERGALVPQAITAGHFDRTLAAIADFRRQYPNARLENNHLTVLEGMVYLQSRQFGLARLIRPDVETAGKALTDIEFAARDALLAESFGHMVSGWELIAREERDKNDPAKKDNERYAVGNRGKEDVVILTSAAFGIRDRLCAERSAGRLTQADGDQGATYLAATAATFLIWADKANDSMCFRGLPDGQCAGPRRGASDNLYIGRDLIRTFLPPGLKLAADSDRRLEADGTMSGATRYLKLFEFATDRIRARSEGELRPAADACTAS